MRCNTSCLRFQSSGCIPRRVPRPDGRIRHYKNILLRSSERIPDLCVQFYKSISSPPCGISKRPIGPLKGLGEYNRREKHCQPLFNEFKGKRIRFRKRLKAFSPDSVKAEWQSPCPVQSSHYLTRSGECAGFCGPRPRQYRRGRASVPRKAAVQIKCRPGSYKNRLNRNARITCLRCRQISAKGYRS